MSTKEDRRRAAAKKKNKKYKKKSSTTTSRPKYSMGNLIQVNDDVMDADWDDLPIGGWVGKITKIHREDDEPTYDVQWTEETMEKCHPIYGQLAKLEDLRVEAYTKLAEEDIHAFAGGEVILVDPGDVSHYTDRPLDPDNEDDRLRMIFGTSPLEHFPTQEYDNSKEENDRLLKRYYDHLSEHLPLPFEATCIYRERQRIVSKHALTIKALISPDVIKAEGKGKAEDWDDTDELYCTGLDPNGTLLEVPLRRIFCDTMPHKQLLDDYRTWAGDLSFLYDQWWANEQED